VASAVAGSGAAAASSRRSGLTLREQRAATSAADVSPALGGNRPRPTASRYGPRSGSASRVPEQAVEGGIRAGSMGAMSRPHGAGTSKAEEPSVHRPGSLFGLAADLGIGPGSLSAAPLASPGNIVTTSPGSDGGADACDIDARLQALQSFLKQTKGITG
jgi:hypothetical protein